MKGVMATSVAVDTYSLEFATGSSSRGARQTVGLVGEGLGVPVCVAEREAVGLTLGVPVMDELGVAV